LKVNVTKGDNWKRILEVEVPQDSIQQELDKTFLKFQKQANLPGFRPGKAPLEMIKTRFKDAATEEVMESLLNSSYRQALEESRLQPLGLPKVKDIQFSAGSSLTYKAEVEVQPEIAVKDYKGLRLIRRILPVGDHEVEEAVNYLRERNAELKPVEREAREKDFVVADLEEHYREKGKPASQKYDNQLLEVDAELLQKEFMEALLGAKMGEEKNFQVEYSAEHSNRRLAGQKVGYRLKVKEIKEKILLPLDDAFAKAQGDYQTLLELKLKIRESLEKKHQQDSQRELESQSIARLVESNRFPVPESLINSYLNYLAEDLKKRYPELEETEIKEKNRKGAEDRIRWEYIYHQLAKQENISADDQDLEERVKAFAANYNLPVDKAREYLNQTKQIDKLKESILEEKVLGSLLSQAQIKEERTERK
jgi:trigger factor